MPRILPWFLAELNSFYVTCTGLVRLYITGGRQNGRLDAAESTCCNHAAISETTGNANIAGIGGPDQTQLINDGVYLVPAVVFSAVFVPPSFLLFLPASLQLCALLP